ncbi:hypothetical protein [Terricaulis sp.]|uniref:hypothetical protein n=1 Tax=Terricaulis sp. TaxID=2768686 RepID=UPI002AC3E832|nr:hypothetical protein [Terricaulis sp.]MDZ4689894.1 hypothetical protein [Terricaulis sp.]
MTTEPVSTYRRSSMTSVDQAARGLAYVSLGLGVAELLFPGALAKALGIQNRPKLLRAYGAREIATGIGALQPNPAPAIWARAAGDVVDLATLVFTRDANGRKSATSAALFAVTAITIADVAVAFLLSKQKARTGPVRDYSDRSGFPRGIEAVRGAAAGRTPKDMRVAPEDRQPAHL